MAQDKKSFVAYCDWLESFEMLEDDEAGKLIKHLLKYVNDLNPELEDRVLKIAWQPMKLQLKRDLNKYDEIRKKRAEYGKKGGKKRAEKAKQAKAKNGKQSQANQADNDNGDVNDNGNVNDTVITSSNDDDVYYTLDTLIDRYLKNYDLVNAVIKNQKLKSTHQLQEKLREFNSHLSLTDKKTKTWADYTSHFLNWLKKNLNNGGSGSNDNPTSNIPIG